MEAALLPIAKLETRTDLERAIALVLVSLTYPATDDPANEALLKMCDPKVGELTMSSRQSTLYARAKLQLHDQRR